MMSAEQPLVSVVIPCYNAERYVEAAVKSITEQSYKNIEVITIDDFSADKTFTVLKKMAAADPRIILLTNEANLGLVATLNKGIAASKGKYIARMDADDISIAERISIQVKYLEQNRDIEMCGGNYIMIDENGNQTGKLKFPNKPEYIKAELLFYCPFCHPTVMMRKSILSKVGYYQEGFVPAEDYELWLRIAEQSSIENLPDYLLYYRWHGNNVTITRKKEQYNALSKAVYNNLQTFGFDEKFISYHLKFLAGLWYEKTSNEEINGFNNWRKNLFKKNRIDPKFNSHALELTFNKYHSLALLSIIKSRHNTLGTKMYAIKELLLINPFITLNHFIKKSGLN